LTIAPVALEGTEKIESYPGHSSSVIHTGNALYVRVDASAADEVASIQANAASQRESGLSEMRIMIVALEMRWRALSE